VQLPSHISRRIDPSASSSPSSFHPRPHFLLYGAAAAAAVAALSFPTSFLDSSTTTTTTALSSCQSPLSPSSNGLADETEDLVDRDDNVANEIVRDGMDTGSETPSAPKIKTRYPHPMTGLADSDEDDDDDDDDDPSKDEETSCSICLINRQGPCRKYWVKFERCMKDHSAEKERRRRELDMEEEEEAKVKAAAERGAERREETDAVVSSESLQEEWDDFMVKSTRPGEDDDEEDDDEEEEEEEEEEVDEQSDHNQSRQSDNEADEGDTLAARCDKYMLPWISCIQEHRNVYSLISNEFYQKDYVDPLEDTIPDERRYPFAPLPSEDDPDSKSSSDAVHVRDNDGDASSPVESQRDDMPYSIRFRGVEVDLESWRECVEADADDNDDDVLNEERKDSRSSSSSQSEREPQPRLINAYAKFKLIEPDGKRPIEVAYVKDQKGRLLGFDSFSKRDAGGSSDDIDDGSGRDGIHDNAGGETLERDHHGECTFHLVPGETTSVRAYAIYREVTSADGDGEKNRECDNILYFTPEIPLPGVDAQSE